MDKKFVERFMTMDSLNEEGVEYERQRRGRAFEELINDVFEFEEVSIKRGGHTSDNKSEEIDGVIKLNNSIFLLEIKWVEKSLAASALHSFHGKVDNKFNAPMGIFISRNQLSDNFQRHLTNNRKQNVLVIHGEDLDDLFKEDGPNICNYIKHCLEIMSYDNIAYYSVRKYIENVKKQNEKAEKELAQEVKMDVLLYANEFLDVSNKSNFLEMQKKYYLSSNKSKVAITEYVLNRYRLLFDEFNSEHGNSSLHNYLAYIFQVEPDHTLRNKIAEVYYDKILQSDLRRYGREDIYSFFDKHLPFISRQKRDKFGKHLFKEFDANYGNYDFENLVTVIYKSVYRYFPDEVNANFYARYLDIFLSRRENRFPQKKFAHELVITNRIGKEFIEDWILSQVKAIIEESMIDLTADQMFSRTFNMAELRRFIDVADAEWKNYILSKFEKAKES